MPGNEVADKVHNFFEQDSLSQSHNQSQVASGSWSVLNSNQWVSNQLHNGSSDVKNYDVQTSADCERARSWQASHIALGTDLTQLSLRPEFAKSEPRNQQLSLNGFMLGPQGFQANPNQTEFLGDDSFPGRHNQMSRNIGIPESQQGNASDYHQGITRNSEQFETVEAPVNFDFLGGPQQFIRNQQLGVPQPRPRQQAGFSDMQLWQQQHFMYKQLQLQELQKQQQLQQLDQESRQHNSLSQLSAIAKQSSGDQLPALVNGAPIHDASNYMWSGELTGGDSSVPSTSQMFMVGNMNWVQRSGSPAAQGFPNGLVFAQDQGQALRSMGFFPQQLDQSLYGTPIGGTRGALNQYAHFQGISHDGADMLTKGSGNQAEKTMMQSAAFSSFQSDRSAAFPNQICTQDGASVSKQGFQGKNSFGTFPMQTQNNGIMTGSFQQVSTLPRSMHMPEFQGKEEQPGWVGNLQDRTVAQVGATQGVNLNPTEEKILFNADDGMLGSSFGRSGSVSASGYLHGNQLEGTDYINAFPAVQSGSWSALMQSAVAEASSSETGLQDEWSGLSFQKTELSSGNNPTTLNDTGKQPTNWVDNSLQSASITSRPFPLFDDANTSPSGHGVPGLQQPTIKFAFNQSETGRINDSHESLQQSSRETGHWLDQNPHQKPLAEGSLQVQKHMHLENSSEGSWGNRMFDQSRRSENSADMELNMQSNQGSWAHQMKMSSYNISGQPCNKPNGQDVREKLAQSGDATLKISQSESGIQHAQSNDGKRDMLVKSDHDGGMWKVNNNLVNLPLPNTAGGLEHVRSGTGSPQVNSEDHYMNAFNTVSNSSASKVNQEISQPALNSHQLEGGKHAFVDSSVNYRGSVDVGNYQLQHGKGPEVLESSMNNTDMYDKKQANFFQRELSNAAQQIAGGGGVRESTWLGGSDSCPLAGPNQKQAVQTIRKPTGIRRFQFHPMGNLGNDFEPADSMMHATRPQGLYHPVARGPQSQEHVYFGESKIADHAIVNNAATMEKGHFPDSQSNEKELKEVPPAGIHPDSGSAGSASFDGSPNNRTVQTSQNMLELLPKVDQPKENDTPMQSGSSRHYSSDLPEVFASDASAAHLQRSSQSSASQVFGLRLAPPSQRLSVSSNALPSQVSSQTVNNLNSRHPEGNSLATDTSSLPNPGIHLQQQHISGVGGQVAIGHCNRSSASQDEQKTSSEHGSHLRWARDSQGGVEADQSAQSSSHGAAGRIPPFNLAPSAEAHVSVASAQSFSGDAGHSLPTNPNSPYLKGSGQEFPATQSPITVGTSQQGAFSTMFHNAWANLSAQQRLSGGPSSKVPANMFQSISPSNSSFEATSWASRKVNDQNMKKGGHGQSDHASCSSNLKQLPYGEEQPSKDGSLQNMSSERDDLASQTAGSSQGQEPVVKHLMEGNSVPSSSVAVQPPHQQDLGRGKHAQEPSQIEHLSLQKAATSNQSIEAFGHSLKPSDFPHQTYSLLQQMQAMKGADMDPSRKGMKRPRGDFGIDALQAVPKTSQRFAYGYNKLSRDPLDTELSATGKRTSFPSTDSKMLCFSSEGKDQNVNSSSQLNDVPSQDMVMFGGNNPQNHSSQPGVVSTSSSLRGAEHPQINPQMAPSWFERYGTYRNGQILGPYSGLDGSHRSAKVAAQQFFFGKVSDSLHASATTEQVNAVDASQVGSVWQSPANASTTSENSSHHSLPPVVVDHALPIVRPMHKSVASELLPQHKEVPEGSVKARSISVAELEWAQATNRRIEQVDDEMEMSEDGSSMPLPRRRLILTSQLMQQLLHSIPAGILCADANEEYENVTYFASKLTLEDANSLISTQSDSLVDPSKRNMTSEKLKVSGSMEQQCVGNVVENFIGRAMKLEDDLLRLEKRASILDIRVECQDLERFSTINRFAIFHGRTNVDGAESSSSSEAMPRKIFPQRYVTALPMPRNLPDGAPCFSL